MKTTDGTDNTDNGGKDREAGFGEAAGSAWKQEGFAVIEMGRCSLPITHYFCAAEWEAEARLREMKLLTSVEFYGKLRVVQASLRFDLPNEKGDSR